MKHDPIVCIGDMIDYARDIGTFVGGMDVEAFTEDRRTQYAVLRALEVIGEAAKRVSPETQKLFPEIPWRQIIGMRNVIAHD
ncbi:HepT-like ribonuclease domain-containing protein [Skermanella stibiiresistens]|uniref:HepT-like ribonuclease domain-containing protein n=1 Tax=Skermanella stibiiresistens TaxID=913326 RepID=UPI0004B11CD6|nr:HepT-like ribonuclease domain-containing protein [Skermanella stibiiresistens]